MALIPSSTKELYSERREIARVDFHDLRYYKVNLDDNQVYYPSVTTILNVYPTEYITEWKAAVGMDHAHAVTSLALAKGSRVHYAIEVILNGGIVIFNPVGHDTFTAEEIDELHRKYNKVYSLKNHIEYNEVIKVVNFLDMVGATDIQSEQTVFSVIHQFAGTGDLLFYLHEPGTYMISGATPVYLDKGWHLGDFKTGKNVSPTAKFQMAAYLVALEEMYPGLRIETSMVLHTNTTTKKGIEGFKAHVYTREECLENFEHFKTIQGMYLVSNPTPSPREFNFPKEIDYAVTRTDIGDMFSE